MFTGVEEHNKFHRFLLPTKNKCRIRVILILKGIHFVDKLFQIGYLLVEARFSFASLCEISENNALDVDDLCLCVFKTLELRGEQLGEVGAIGLRRESVVEDTHIFIEPKFQHHRLITSKFGVSGANALEHLPDIAQIECVVLL